MSGVSDSGAQRLALFLDFSTELPASPPFSADFSKDFGTLINLRPEDEAPERLLCALEELATFCADWPHPATRGNYRRAELPSGHKEKLPATDVSDHVEVLEDSTYYHRLKDLLDSASSRIDLAMFFISYTGASHPSKVLLQRLADRHDDGVAVRVIVDRDDEDDPYGSRVINQPAIQFLKNRGVAVKTDKTTNLLHSKFVVIDDSRVVIGSHNWTAGSYFRYHDASLSILSNAFAAEVSQRFEMLWSEGEEA